MSEFKLDKTKIASGFKTPERYFEQFPLRISHRLGEEPKVVDLISRKTTWILAAAAILVFALCVRLFDKTTASSDQIDPLATENYLAMQEGTSDHLVELFDEEDIRNIKIDINLEDQSIEDVLSTNPDLEQYIIN